MEALADYAETLPRVAFVQRNLYSCSEGGINEIKKGIKEQHLNRVVVASCTPRTHEPLFRSSCEEAGLNPYLFEMVNIRDQCSWVHMQQKEDATAKAKDLIRMGLAKAALLKPQKSIMSLVQARALVIGGGLAGMTASTALAKRGYEVVLVEKEKTLGGMLNRLNKLGPTMMDASELIEAKIQEVTQHDKITVFTGTRVSAVQGFIGKFQADIETESGQKNIDIGVILVATGGRVFVPKGLYGYDGERVITQLEMEQLLKEGLAADIKNVVMIQCVGSRNQKRAYCSRICCQTAVKNAMLIKDQIADARVSILYRDMQMYGVENEEMFRDSKAKGVRYMHYDPDKPPQVEADQVQVYHSLLGREINLPADLVVLSTPVVAQEDAERTSQLLRVPIDENGFFLEGHVKLKPLDFATDGVYLCGSARFPANIREVIAQGLGSASRASIPLSRGSIVVEPIISVLADEDACRGCGLCVVLCPYGALEIHRTEKGKKVHVIDVTCKGCGVCAATCYQHALSINSYTSEQIEAQIDAFLELKIE
ncbi:MAG: CoB--CoM heterodisulfide reductase iron-sulfur subunit A family protein [Desulfobacterales bacterium]|uniref:CoB--CoM heterodisulfide reductase iron-sulfur subunit A family protein n=1 Tax=Candidatus Desulfatibia profunda TaxID=2841695 RepID=A0A8J6NMA3_9BACT|nr:CoB--CoM heterodisulfide reductase iron-sulfur subunit A family protein [Candidatus Desulfatibia profunda]MBL7178880.1 CoB--CoM heterodisulfide reductase iron-sulfur subunit A family protein [Desulfobacterales bacterium]